MEENLNVALTINYTHEDLNKLVIEISTLLSAAEAGRSFPMLECQRGMFMGTLTAIESKEGAQ